MDLHLDACDCPMCNRQIKMIFDTYVFTNKLVDFTYHLDWYIKNLIDLELCCLNIIPNELIDILVNHVLFQIARKKDIFFVSDIRELMMKIENLIHN